MSGAPDAFVLQGDALEVLRGIDADTFEAVVTDPPYGLGREPSPEELTRIVRAWALGEHVPVTGRGFMGRSWDAFVPGSAIWCEVLRVLKPGGHVLAFAGSRTVDLMGLSLRLAGFEIRDQLQWIYGSGFPKSLDVSKAIDAAAGAERAPGTTRVYAGGHVQRSSETIGYGGSDPAADTRLVTAPATPEAAAWSGWGTALKPAHEPIIMARKPLAGTVAANVLEHGTGAINVDGCRVNPGAAVQGGGASARGFGGVYGDGRAPANAEPHNLGRWPANVILDEAAGAMLDAQTSGQRAAKPAGGHVRHNTGTPSVARGAMRPHAVAGHGGEGGGASRFFYRPKASRAERNAGGVANKHPTVKPIALMRWLVRLVTPPGGAVLDPFTGSGTTGAAAVLEGFDFVGVELDAEHVALAEARIAHWRKAP